MHRIESIYRYLFDRRRDLPLPSAFLLDKSLNIVRVYQGSFSPGELLSDAARAGAITLPSEAPGKRHVYHQYVVRAPDRDAVRERLSRAGIATAVFYPVPLHLQECFAGLGYREGSFPVAEKAAGEVLALPIFAEMRDYEIERVAEAVLKATAAG